MEQVKVSESTDFEQTAPNNHISGAAHGQLQASGGSQQVVQDETGRGRELLFIFLSTLTLSSKNVDYALKAKI